MIYSHYDPEKGLKKELTFHLNEVYTGMMSIINSVSDIELLKGIDNLNYIVKLIAYLHDIGKATSFFQKKLLNEPLKQNELCYTKHSLLGAVLGFYITEQLGFNSLTSYIVYRIIHSHHSSFHKNKDLLNLDTNKLSILRTQYNDIINNKESQEIIHFISENINIPLPDIKEFNELTQETGIIANELITCLTINEFGANNNETDYYSWLYFFLLSALNRADKYSASFNSAYDMENAYQTVFSKSLSPSFIEDHLANKKNNSKKPSSPIISSLRDDFFLKVKTNATAVNLDHHLYSIYAPTGIGKTLSLLNAAIIMQNRIQEDKKQNFKIIYGLPFLSIIDQVSDEITEILQLAKYNINWNIFQEYHHLSTPIVSSEEKEEEQYKQDQIQLLSSFWDSQIILTTFVSLLETISDSRQSIKLASLASSIIIIDEVQSVDAGLYEYVKWFILHLTKYLGSYVIISSATMPDCFRGNEFISLIGDQNAIEEPFRKLNRYKIYKPIECNFDQFTNNVMQFIKKQPDKYYLIVANTRRMAYELAKWFNKENFDICFLSTLVIPYQRKARIKDIRDGIKPHIIVSTQLIEAGVDMSVDYIFRFLAPFDNIIQTAGRTNRHYESGSCSGTVNLIDMCYDNNKKDYNLVYVSNSKRSQGDIKMNNTIKILNRKDIYCEKEIFDLSNEYFKNLSTVNYWETAYNKLKDHQWNDFGNEIRIINNELETVSIVIDYRDWSEKVCFLWEKHNELIDKLNKYDGDIYSLKAELKDNLRQLSNYMLNIYLTDTKNLIEFDKNKKSIQLIRGQYDSKLGLNIFGKESINCF